MNRLMQLRATAHGYLHKVEWFPPLFARIAVGVIFFTSGWGKLNNLAGVTQFFESLGIPAASIQAPFVAATEFVCGGLLLIGLGTRLVAFPLIGTMVVAILTAKRADIHGVSDLFGMSEFLYIPLLMYLIVWGGGKASADFFIAYKCDGGHTHDHHHHDHHKKSA